MAVEGAVFTEGITNLFLSDLWSSFFNLLSLFRRLKTQEAYFDGSLFFNIFVQ